MEIRDLQCDQVTNEELNTDNYIEITIPSDLEDIQEYDQFILVESIAPRMNIQNVNFLMATLCNMHSRIVITYVITMYFMITYVKQHIYISKK